MEKEELPKYSRFDRLPTFHQRSRVRRCRFRIIVILCSAALLYWLHLAHIQLHDSRQQQKPAVLSDKRLAADFETCDQLDLIPQDPKGPRQRNARYVEGQKPILLKNASVWTGEASVTVSEEQARQGKGFDWIHADVFVEHGLIKAVNSSIPLDSLPSDCEIFHLNGARVTSGVVDMHSHTGVDTLPSLNGNSDVNELSSDITPYVRSIDGLNPLDDQIQVIKSGGVTTSLILPGSGNNIGGEAFVIKHAVGKRDGRSEISIADMLADPDRNHRYMKMACGENAKSVYGRVGRDFGPFSRLGEAFYFRHAFEEASKLKDAQDDWCATARQFGPQNMQSYLPQDLKWESLIAVLRGQVMVNTHCYTIPDLESFVGYTNEFKFPVRAFHHAHQTYLIPEVLKRVYGGRPPAAALFADNMYYKAESYVASEKAGKWLWEAGITPVYVSDNPVLNAQHVIMEAAKAFHNGLPYHVALAGVTSASAELLGLGERIGKVKSGFDADVVIWDSDPLSFGASPIQVFIDGVPQFEHPVKLNKTSTPSLLGWKPRDLADEATDVKDVVITGIAKVLIPGHEETYAEPELAHVVIANGSIVCMGLCNEGLSAASHVVHLQEGVIAPPLTAFGSSLGLEEIAAEGTTSDGANDPSSFSKAIDGLMLEGKNLKAAYTHGVTKAISAPNFNHGGHKGASVGFRIGAKHALDHKAVFRDTVALHYPLTPGAKQDKTPSLSSAIGELRGKLTKALKKIKSTSEERSVEDKYLAQVISGRLPLVIDVHSADTIASLLRLKEEIDALIADSSSSSTSSPPKLRLVILGGAEAHILAAELAHAGVGVILAPVFAYGETWDQRRALTGAPLTAGTAVDVLHAAGVRVALGVDEDWEARDLYVQAGIVFANGGGNITAAEAIALASSRIYEILGLEEGQAGGLGRSGEKWEGLEEFVVFEGNPLDVRSQVRVVADGRGSVSVYE